jgi:hypothetical protein
MLQAKVQAIYYCHNWEHPIKALRKQYEQYSASFRREFANSRLTIPERTGRTAAALTHVDFDMMLLWAAFPKILRVNHRFSSTVTEQEKVKTFFAVLAAGAVIFTAFLGCQRLDRWEQAKAFWTAQLRQAQDNMPREIPHDIMVNLSADDLTEAINRLDQASRAHTHAAYELRLCLGNKPFGLPLTDEQNRLKRSDSPGASCRT